MSPHYRKWQLLFCFTLLFSFCSYAQFYTLPVGWFDYTSTYDFVPGSVHVNMDRYAVSPDTDMPFLIIAGVGFPDCSYDGFPTSAEEIKLAAISDSIMHIVSSLTRGEKLGSFSCQCKKTDYIYVHDTTGLRKKLIEQYAAFKNYSPQIWLKPDSEWKAYRTFLYPSEEILTLLENEKKVAALRQAGDLITKPRVVTHDLAFAKKKNRKTFITYATEQGFTISKTGKKKSPDRMRYYLSISQTDIIEPKHITHLILDLSHKAKEMNGIYRQWDCAVTKE